jgi:hypothetical protein
MNNSNNTELEKPDIDGIPYRYMTAEEEAELDIITQDSFYKPKYRNGLKIMTKLDVQEYYRAHPDCKAKDLLSDMMKEYNPEIPTPILLEMAQVILEEWERLTASKKDLVLA